MRGDGPREFRTTHWSVVLEAGKSSEQGHSALETLCRSYWYPLYVFVRRRGYDEHQAQDLTQEFFARLLADDSLEAVHPSKGRFRTFLLASLKNFLANEHRDSMRLKRGGGRELLSWDELQAEERFAVDPVAPGTSPETIFDRRWAQTLVSAALGQLQKEMEREGTPQRFAVLKLFLQGDGGATSYLEAAERLGLSAPAVKSAIYRMRRRYGQLIREELAQTVGSAEEVEAEIQHLIATLAGE
jgi:RNA polymerase sigma factor (sigma-70 family)